MTFHGLFSLVGFKLFTESCWKGTKAQAKFEEILDISNIICGSLATSPHDLKLI
jgi:hypothetical protein